MNTYGKKMRIRQFSIQNDNSTSYRRRSLKKQFSEDIPFDSKNDLMSTLDDDFLLCSKNQKLADRPLLPTKEAWAETNDDHLKRIAEKKTTFKLSEPKDSILLSHQELAERLRQAWKDREKSKHNLNIFLASNVREKQDDLTDSEITYEDVTSASPVILPNKNLDAPVAETNFKSIFQKRMRRAHSTDESLGYRNRAVVVVPLTSQKTQDTAFEPKEKTNVCKPIDVVIRPLTSASSKRENFKNRTNFAFNGSPNVGTTKESTRAPLIRASSVPLKQAHSKTVKKRTRSAYKQRGKIEDEDVAVKNKNHKLQRCFSASGAEVITMVSLVSPEGSDVEDKIEVEIEKPKPKVTSPVKTVSAENNARIEHQTNFTLRKAVKSVSFQQSSIHAVRSFSASFPARRASVVTALMAGNNSSSGKSFGSSLQEKRGSIENVSEELREPKRRLLRSKSTTDETRTSHKEPILIPKDMEKLPNCSEDLINSLADGSKKSETTENEPSKSTLNDGQQQNSETESCESPKEKQCWDMYCKMSKKGINVSFDTILRGMLTPTEYRLRRKSISYNEAENVEKVME